MSKNFLNFLTTSVIILSCGTAINSSSCYCMESKILSPQNQELSQKLLTELSKMDADIKDELKRNQIIVDKNGQPIENESFFTKDLLRSSLIVYFNAFKPVLQSVGVSDEIIQQLDSCMTYCRHVGDRIEFSLQQVWLNYKKNSSQDIERLISNQYSYLRQLSEFQNYADNNDDSNFIEGSYLLRDDIIGILQKISENVSYYYKYDSVLQYELISKLHMKILELQQLLGNNDSSNNNQCKNIHDILKKKLMSQLSNIISGLQQLDIDLSNHANDLANFLQDISASQNIAKLTDIMEGTGETVNINNDNINTITWQQLLNYLQNKIHLITINDMQNIKEYIEEYIKQSINNNTMDAKEIAQKIIDPAIVCCDKVLRIADNLKAYLSSIINNSNFDYKQRALAKKINEEKVLIFYIKHLTDATEQLQQIQEDYKNKKINNIKQDEGSKIIDKHNNLLSNNTILHAINNINNVDQIENSNIKKENSTMNATNIAQNTIKQIMSCSAKVQSISSDCNNYLSMIITNDNVKDKPDKLAQYINYKLNVYIEHLKDATKQLQQIKDEYNNKNSNNIKKENNNAVPNEAFIKFKNALNNIEPIENIKQSENSKNIKQNEDSNITEEHSNSILNDAFLKSRDELNNSAQIIKNNNIPNSEDEKIIKEHNNSLQDNSFYNLSKAINNGDQIDNRNNMTKIENDNPIDSNTLLLKLNEDILKESEDSKITKEDNNSVPNESFIKFREALNNIAQSENSKNIK